MTRSTIFAVLAFSTVALVGTVHAAPYSESTNQKGAKTITTGYTVPGCADYKIKPPYTVQQICNPWTAPNMQEKIKRGPHG